MVTQHSDMERSLLISVAQAEEVIDKANKDTRMAMEGKLSDWAIPLWNGDVDSVRNKLENLSEDELMQQ